MEVRIWGTNVAEAVFPLAPNWLCEYTESYMIYTW